MTGTADTEAFEFQSIYNLETVIIPTNRPVQRKDFNDQTLPLQLKKNLKPLSKTLPNATKRSTGFGRHHQHRKPELVSDLLHKAGLPHNVLNAKEHEREALIVAQAGKVGVLPLLPNMAGRGTDIVLAATSNIKSKPSMPMKP